MHTIIKCSLGILACFSLVFPANNPPVVKAGNDTTAQAGVIFVLKGSATDDLLISDSLLYTWKKIAGPDTGVTINYPDQARTAAKSNSQGVCTFVLTVSDNVNTASDTVNITVGSVFVAQFLSPVTGAKLTIGSTLTIGWTVETPVSVHLNLFQKGAKSSIRLTESAPIPAGITSYSWTIPDSIKANDSCWIQVENYFSRTQIAVSGKFSIASTNAIKNNLSKGISLSTQELQGIFAVNGSKIPSNTFQKSNKIRGVLLMSNKAYH